MNATDRASVHVSPVGTLATLRHYLPDLVYGANDGIITTFAVVAGVAYACGLVIARVAARSGAG